MTQFLFSGDFNIHIDNASDSFANQFNDILFSFKFTQHITEPPHNQGHTLDLNISKGPSVSPKLLDVGIFDHFCIFFNTYILIFFLLL